MSGTIVDGCSYPDALPGGWSRRLVDERTLRVELHGVPLDWVAAPDILVGPKTALGGDGFVKGCAQSGLVYLPGEFTPAEDQSDRRAQNRLMVGGASGWRIMPTPCVAVDGCAIGWHGDHMDVVVQVSGTEAIRLHFRNGIDADPIGDAAIYSPTGPTSFGFLEFDPSIDGPACVRWTDANRSFTVDGWPLRFPQSAGGVIVGQYHDNPDWIGGIGPTGRFTLCEEQAGAPRISTQGGRYIVVAPLMHHRCLYAELPPFPAFIPEVGTNLPDPDDPPDEDEPVSTPNRIDIVRAVCNDHPDLVKSNTRVSCGTLTEYIAWALHQADAGWGLLSKSPGENQFNGHGVDSVIYQPTQQVVDVLVASGAREEPDPSEHRDTGPTWDEVPKRENNNWMQPIPPADVIVEPPDDEDDDEDDDLPPIDAAAVQTIVTAITAASLSTQQKLDGAVGIVTDLVVATSEQAKETARLTLAINRLETALADVKARQDRALNIDASARFIGHIGGTVKP